MPRTGDKDQICLFYYITMSSSMNWIQGLRSRYVIVRNNQIQIPVTIERGLLWCVPELSLGSYFKNMRRDFPGGPVVKTSPSSAGGVGSISGLGGKIPHASQPKNQNIKQKQYCNKLSKDLKKKWSTSKNKKILKSIFTYDLHRKRKKHFINFSNDVRLEK